MLPYGWLRYGSDFTLVCKYIRRWRSATTTPTKQNEKLRGELGQGRDSLNIKSLGNVWTREVISVQSQIWRKKKKAL